MKATELMIGDWVMCDRTRLQVSEIYNAGIYAWGLTGDENRGYPFEHLEPILLTEDILQKNGFKYLDISSPKDTINRFVWRYSTDSQNIDLSYNKFTKDYMLDSFRIHLFPIIYVHELQHALRMGGIEKEIEL